VSSEASFISALTTVLATLPTPVQNVDFETVVGVIPATLVVVTVMTSYCIDLRQHWRNHFMHRHKRHEENCPSFRYGGSPRLRRRRSKVDDDVADSSDDDTEVITKRRDLRVVEHFSMDDELDETLPPTGRLVLSSPPLLLAARPASPLIQSPPSRPASPMDQS
jgi:hypothetical protein